MKIGLALAGGGSLGAYQVGILKYLKEKNWHFDVVTGTSVGAINGALVVTDDIEELEKLWLEISNDKIMLNGMDLNKELLTELNPDHIFKFLKTFGTLKGVKITPFKELCKKYIDPVKIQQSACEFGTICVDFPKLVEEKIDMKKIDAIIDSTPSITEIQKNFYKTMLSARKERILDFALEKQIQMAAKPKEEPELNM